MRISVLLFARLRELAGSAQRTIELASGACVGDAWPALVREVPALAAFSSSTRAARNGRVADAGDPLAEGDELAFLPPVGGG